jgi:hypothetical protein
MHTSAVPGRTNRKSTEDVVHVGIRYKRPVLSSRLTAGALQNVTRVCFTYRTMQRHSRRVRERTTHLSSEKSAPALYMFQHFLRRPKIALTIKSTCNLGCDRLY